MLCQRKENSVKPLLHDQIFFDKFHMPNVFERVNYDFSTNLHNQNTFDT